MEEGILLAVIWVLSSLCFWFCYIFLNSMIALEIHVH